MRLYQFPFSSNARRARLAAIEVGAKVEEVFVNLAAGEQRQPAYLALNPFGRVPTLVDGDFVLTESHAIMGYLADKVGPTPLFPKELQARADIERWFFWSAGHLTPAVGVLTFERMIKGLMKLGEPDPKEEARGERLVGECLAYLDAHLAKHEWLAQGRLTLADLAVATPFTAAVPSRLKLEDKPHLQAWLGRIRERDSWQKTEPPRIGG